MMAPSTAEKFLEYYILRTELKIRIAAEILNIHEKKNYYNGR